jgi:hypothetical protein
MQVSGAHRVVAHEQLSVAQLAGRDWQLNVAGQPAMQPGGPPSGQLGVSLLPAGHTPPSGRGLQMRVPQFWWLTQSCPVSQAAASPHDPESYAASLVPASGVPDDDLQPATKISASSAQDDDRSSTGENANTPPQRANITAPPSIFSGMR